MKTLFITLIYVSNLLFTNVESLSPSITKMFSDRNSLPSSKLIEFPKLNYKELTEQTKYDLQWYVVGASKDFLCNKPYKVQIWNRNYVLWKNDDNKFIALDDACPHKGAALSSGKICNDHVVCPYHGYEFNENGTLTKVPGICFQPSPIYDVSKYDTIEKNGWVYLNTHYFNLSENITVQRPPEYDNIYVEPEVAQNCSVVHLDMNYNCYSRILSENSLDIMHIAFVHSFGNINRPNPIREDPPKLVGPNHYKSTYFYEAGEDSIARKAFGVTNLTIENEFILPHTTVARVIFGDYVSTVITFALPIGDKKSKLFVKTYRNFWENKFGDALTRNTMLKTMLQDKAVVESIAFDAMDGKFNMKFDKLQNTYTSFYKRFIHSFTDDSNDLL